MTRALLLAAIAAPLLIATAAQAQTRPLPPGASAMERHRFQADQHRYEMDRQRLQADQREATARQMQTETRLNRLEIEARRQPEPYIPASPPALRSPEQERESREAATARRELAAGQVGEIDAWLDRRPN